MIISYAGERGSYSHLACQSSDFQDRQAVAYASFEAALLAVGKGHIDQAMIPIENPVGGRVTAVHTYLRHCELSIIAEHFQPVQHCLMACDGTTLDSLQEVLSHPQALDQCQRFLSKLGLRKVEASDTASAAREVATMSSTTTAAIASRAAAKLWQLKILDENIQDLTNNTTRFVVFARPPQPIMSPNTSSAEWITACLLHLPKDFSALSKSLACLVTRRICVIKCETYMTDTSFQIDAVYLEFIGHPQHPTTASAMAAIGKECLTLRHLGTFRAKQRRQPITML